MIEAVRDYAIFMLDPSGIVTSWNVGAERLKGYTAREIIGRHFSTFYTQYDRDRDHSAEELKLALEHGRYEEEGWRVRKDGGQFWASVVITAVFDRTGQHIGFGKVTRDMTERKSAEALLLQAKADLETRVQERTRELQAANSELEAFSYSVSHDLRSPLRALDGFSRILLDTTGDKLDAQQQDYLQRIRAAAKRMGELIDAMLMLARLTNAPIRVQRVDVTAIASELTAELARSDANRQVQITIQPGLVADADARLLRITLDNLLRNAWKFTRETAAATIEVGKTDAAFFVRDNGVGFEPTLAHNLFLPFQRLHNARTYEGTGIGLATVHRIVVRHRGRIWAESSPGAGATFYFTLGALGGE